MAVNQITPVQTTSGIYTVTASSLTLTFPNVTSAGNTIVVVVGSQARPLNNASGGTVTIGPSSSSQFADNFTMTSYNPETNANITTFVDSNCMGNAVTVVIGQTSNDYMAAYAFELPGIWYADIRSFGWGTSTTWGTNETLPLPLQSFAIGLAFYVGGQTLTPSAITGWTNLTEVTVASGYSAVAGYQTYGAGSNAVYGGTAATSAAYGAGVMCFTQNYSAQSALFGVWRGEGGWQTPNGAAFSGQPTSAQAIANIEAYEAWINEQVSYILDYQYYAPTSWSNFENCWLGSSSSQSYGPSNWGSVLGQRTLCLSLSPCAGVSIGSGGATWAAEAAGTNDTHWTNLGNNLIAWGLGSSVIRLGREFNGNWYNWSPANTGDSAANYILGYQHIVTLLRGLTGAHFTFMWNPTLGQGNLSSDYLVNWYPGSTYVDSCGIDMYDWGDYPPESDVFPVAARTTAQLQTNWNWLQQTVDGLNQWQVFLTTGAGAGKPLVFPEYGLQNWASGGNYIGGGDDTYYIQQVEAWVGASQWSAMWEDKDMGLFEADSITASRMCLPDLSRQVFLTEFTTQPFIPISPVPQLNPMPAGYIAQAVDMNYLAACAQFLLNKPITRIHDTVGSQVIQVAAAPITFGTADFDGPGASAMFNATFPTRLTVITPGYYKLSYMVSTTVSSTCFVGSYGQVTSGPNNPAGVGIKSRVWPGYAFGASTDRACPHGQGIVPFYLYAGDYVEIYAYSNNTDAELFYGQSSFPCSFFELEYVSI